MRAAIQTAFLFLFASSVIPAQSPKLNFEVASVRLANPGEDGDNLLQGGPGSTSPSRFVGTNVTMQSLLMRAYGVKADQLSGPEWIRSARFDINAAVPADSTQDQLNQMLQSLIVERFHFTFHTEKKEFPVYALMAGKNGPKLTASTGDPNASPAPPAAHGAVDKNGFPILPAGRGPVVVMQSACNGNHLIARAQTPAGIAKILESGLGERVVDKTGLTGAYDLTLRYKPIRATVCQSMDGSIPSVLDAVQKQLGLRLEKSTNQFDVMVIDHLDKTPVEN